MPQMAPRAVAKLIPFNEEIIAELEKLLKEGKITTAEKLEVINVAMLQLPLTKDVNLQEAIKTKIRDKVSVFRKRTAGVAAFDVPLKQVEEWIDMKTAKFSGGAIVTVLLAVAAAAFLLYYKIAHGADYTVSAATIVGILAAVYAKIRADAIKRVAFIIQTQATTAEGVKKNAANCFERLILKCFGFGNLLQLQAKACCAKAQAVPVGANAV